jgi:hypothetical protein
MSVQHIVALAHLLPCSNLYSVHGIDILTSEPKSSDGSVMFLLSASAHIYTLDLAGQIKRFTAIADVWGALSVLSA